MVIGIWQAETHKAIIYLSHKTLIFNRILLSTNLMMGKRGRYEKRARFYISYSSSGSEEGWETSESEHECHCGAVDTSSSISCDSSSEDYGSDFSESDDERGESSEYEDVKEEGSDDHVNRAICLLGGGGDLQELKLAECKAYLRKNGLRLSGTKDECIERILEHWRIIHGKGETFYPRSSFKIDCTGDVCKGDVVLFTQEVYKNFDKVTRSADVLGKRTVAGRIVKESYGAAKQQHTFTVEVLWSQGVKKLPPLFPLLVKGRNLYKLKTLRQRWPNEKERLGVLAEKHRRGTTARLVRETSKKRSMKRKQSITDTGGVKKQKCDQIRSSQVRQSLKGRKPEKEKQTKKRGSKKSSTDHHGKLPPTGKQKMNQGKKTKATSSHQRPPNYANSYQFRESSFHMFAYQSDIYHEGTFVPPQNHQFQSGTYNQRIPHPYSHDRASASTMNKPRGSSSSSAMAKGKQRK
ncbi:zinc finger CCCH domain-containing protein 62-like isoform X1 [Ipomoea triloba]|uniref:zinc finger CCCH domain-containing protein 62-like isoform X1 n=1 Tax=Ipomoea triloba TaxID=35885 RepID=UPI00125CF654|nr:zinc finger CCCH domain-containing protein 62-like isoform X1 [Ipomoea triloba]